MAAHDTAIDRLVELGRQQGYVTVDQITTMLPIASMSEAEIAGAVERLEQAGVQVEIDEVWLARRRMPGEDVALDVPKTESVRAAELAPGPGVRPRAPADATTWPLDRQDERREEGPALTGPPPGNARANWLPLLILGLVVVVLVVFLIGWLG